MASEGNFHDVVWLYVHGANLEAKDSQGLTPLAVAVRERKPLIVKTLIAFKADVNSKATNRHTIRHHLTRGGEMDESALTMLGLLNAVSVHLLDHLCVHL